LARREFKSMGEDSENLVRKAAKFLANLTGVETAGQEPDRAPNLDIELFTRNNTLLAPRVILAGLIRGDADQRGRIIAGVERRIFLEKSIEEYLFDQMRMQFSARHELDIEALDQSIAEFAPTVWNEQASPSDARLWQAIKSLTPTREQVERAVELSLRFKG
jgi:transposase